MATLNQWLQKLTTRSPEHEIFYGLHQISTVLKRFTDWKLTGKIITVAGTNGKGSAIAIMESIFLASGLSCGATTSPHFFKFNERIRINGCEVDDQVICDAFARIEQVRDEVFLSFFEMYTLSSLLIFAQQELDVILLEIGMGGRLDAMNVVNPDIAVITTVDLDHQQWLGNTIEEIAKEKAGIIRPEIPVIYGEMSTPKAIINQVHRLQAKPFFYGRHFCAVCNETDWSFYSNCGRVIKNLPIPYLPFTSGVCAVQAVLLAVKSIKVFHIVQGLTNARLIGRHQWIIWKKINICLDVAHNAQSGRYLAKLLQKSKCIGKRISLVAMLNDKDYQATLTYFLSLFTKWHVSTVNSERKLSGTIIKDWLLDKQQKVEYFETIGQSLLAILPTMHVDDELIVFGSFYTVTEVFLALNEMGYNHEKSN